MLVFALKYVIISSPGNNKKYDYYCRETKRNKKIILFSWNLVILYLGDEKFLWESIK